MQPLIQIAGIKSFKEAELLIECGVEYLGFPLRLDVHKPDLSDSDAAHIIEILGDRCKAVLITYLNTADEILAFMKFLNTRFVQVHGAVAVEQLRKLRAAEKDLFIIKSLVVHADNEAALRENVQELAPYVDAFITDTFDPKTGASGATGKTHDWNISKRLVELSPKPVILAGGINATNVREAIDFVRPAGVDAHTGVEDRNGDKDPVLVKKFVEGAYHAFKIGN